MHKKQNQFNPSAIKWPTEVEQNSNSVYNVKFSIS